MRFFVTGASGFIGSAVVAELRGAGHEVVGLTRSEAGEAAVAALGAEPVRGTIEDTDLLHDVAERADGVIHLAFNHDFSRFAESAREEAAVIAALGDALAGTGHPLTVASGTMGLAPGRIAVESDIPTPNSNPRSTAWNAALALAGRGVRATAVRLAPSVHDTSRAGFGSVLIESAQRAGVSGYVDGGEQRWPAVHVTDAAKLFRLAAEKGEAGKAYHAVGEQGVKVREIADAIGRRLGLPVQSVPAGEASERFGFVAGPISIDSPASSEWTRQALGWTPTGPGLLADLARWELS
ncbi:SDR family oxidoreductase [Tsukamurella sp. 8F]|uniref:SDR family oxidoreductase n=1 Tax=unclassified Tsukamurella TaxID=2633480 RepID=UPI0023B911E3|nr:MULTISPECIES: SDR family oxidoreductase [unclassified Tsukamurella]MDF0531498.1 SDR family oxidoreductase [Tsukamurella sp. 8J]MDF0588742.1 SDR family oxidoreductase [Tsukamurella sp. 8F]